MSRNEWRDQWEEFFDDREDLLRIWIGDDYAELMQGKRVLELGSGAGYHASRFALTADSVVSVDLNTSELARQRFGDIPNVKFLEGDVLRLDYDSAFDVICSIGVLHHTDDPIGALRSAVGYARQKGIVLLWVYSNKEFLARWIESFRKKFLSNSDMSTVKCLTNILTPVFWTLCHTVYRLNLGFLPAVEYFRHNRKLPYARMKLNIFDKLNAPQTHFFSKSEVLSVCQEIGVESVEIIDTYGCGWSIRIIR